MKTNLSRRRFVGLAASLALSGCALPPGLLRLRDMGGGSEGGEEPVTEDVQDVDVPPVEQPREEPAAPALVRRSFDLHCDSLDELCMQEFEPFASNSPEAVHSGTLLSADTQVSGDRMGDMGWAQCYAIWVPDDCPSVSYMEFYRHGSAFFHRQMGELADRFQQVRTGAEARAALDSGRVAAMLTVENSAFAEEGLGVVEEMASDGVRIASLTWNGYNALGSGVGGAGGLTQLGRDYVGELERHGVVVDVSHLNDEGFWDVCGIASRPFVATHSNSRALCDVPRNLTDDQFCAIRDGGGIVGLNFCGPFVVPEQNDYDFDQLMAHVEHWVNDLGGQDVVALGSDRDGSPIPGWLSDCSCQASLYDQCLGRLGEDLTRRLFFDNAADFLDRYGA